nr:hypothetical protein CFP56_20994 [Quercus suber]
MAGRLLRGSLVVPDRVGEWASAGRISEAGGRKSGRSRVESVARVSGAERPSQLLLDGEDGDAKWIGGGGGFSPGRWRHGDADRVRRRSLDGRAGGCSLKVNAAEGEAERVVAVLPVLKRGGLAGHHVGDEMGSDDEISVVAWREVFDGLSILHPAISSALIACAPWLDCVDSSCDVSMRRKAIICPGSDPNRVLANQEKHCLSLCSRCQLGRS